MKNIKDLAKICRDRDYAMTYTKQANGHFILIEKWHNGLKFYAKDKGSNLCQLMQRVLTDIESIKIW